MKKHRAQMTESEVQKIVEKMSRKKVFSSHQGENRDDLRKTFLSALAWARPNVIKELEEIASAETNLGDDDQTLRRLSGWATKWNINYPWIIDFTQRIISPTEFERAQIGKSVGDRWRILAPQEFSAEEPVDAARIEMVVSYLPEESLPRAIEAGGEGGQTSRKNTPGGLVNEPYWQFSENGVEQLIVEVGGTAEEAFLAVSHAWKIYRKKVSAVRKVEGRTHDERRTKNGIGTFERCAALALHVCGKDPLSWRQIRVWMKNRGLEVLTRDAIAKHARGIAEELEITLP